MKNAKLGFALVLTTLVMSPVYAYQFDGTYETPVTVTGSLAKRAGDTMQTVTLLNIKLTDKEKQALTWRQPHTKNHLGLTANNKLPPAVQLGMNNVPVLNQGRHGSCVTFATSAAIDAIYGSDYISQLCSLELGTHLEMNGYMPSGWAGSYGPLVLEQMLRFGIVSKKTQATKSCADMTEYPVTDANNTGNEMSLVEFKGASENINESVYWKHLFSNDQVFDWKTDAPEQMEVVLKNVKTALKNGHRLTFGTFIIKDGSCRGGACATHQSNGDTWALTAGLETPPYDVGGHEMVITGYDDNATAYDQFGGKHQGLLTLRNSWGEDVGDNGNYYMSYDYFIKYANEVQEIIPIKN